MDSSHYGYDGYRYHSNEYISRRDPYNGYAYDPPSYREPSDEYSFQRNHRYGDSNRIHKT